MAPEERVKRYLKDLDYELSQLGSSESADIVEEIRSHLEDAGDEPGGVDAAIAEFGDARALAVGILRERGLLTEGARVPEAPLWRRAGAWVIDAGIAGLLVVWVLVWVVGTMGSQIWKFEGVARDTLVYGAVWFAVAALWAVLYWANRSPAANRPSWGLFLMGVRRVGVRGHVRTVRASAVGGTRPGWMFAVGGLVAVLMVAGTVAGAWQSARSSAEYESSQQIQLAQDAVQWDMSSFSQTASLLALAAVDESGDGEGALPQMTKDGEQDFAKLVADAKLLSATTYRLDNVSELTYRDNPPDMKGDAWAAAAFTLWGRDASGEQQGRMWTVRLMKKVSDIRIDESGSGGSWSTSYLVTGLYSDPVTLTAGQ